MKTLIVATAALALMCSSALAKHTHHMKKHGSMSTMDKDSMKKGTTTGMNNKMSGDGMKNDMSKDNMNKDDMKK
jgi:pentapeptide MXKDX repeat protein